MKKVVILHPAFWMQAMGGAELQISYLVKRLLLEKCEIHYIFEDKGKIISSVERIYLHPLKRIILKKRFGSRWFLYKKQINRLLNEIKPDIIYTRMFSSWSGIASIYAKSNSIQHIYAIASDQDLRVFDKANSFLKLLDFFERKYVKQAFKLASVILTQNQYQQTNLQEKFEREGVLIQQAAELCEEELILKEESPYTVVWIANLKKVKRPEYFIEVVRALKDEKCIEFKMIGRGIELYSDLIKNAENTIPNFEYLGELKNSEVNDILCKAHILVNTSDYEGFSNTFVQAWMRKVVVISMNSNPDNILTEQKIGFVCPTGKDMITKIKELVLHSEYLSSLGNKAFSYARENHSTNKNLQKIIDLMNL